MQADEFRIEKPLAYQGYRQRVLDCVAGIGRLVGNLGYHPNSNNTLYKEQLVEQKRQFTSEIQRILDPRERSRESSNLTKSSAAP